MPTEKPCASQSSMSSVFSSIPSAARLAEGLGRAIPRSAAAYSKNLQVPTLTKPLVAPSSGGFSDRRLGLPGKRSCRHALRFEPEKVFLFS